MSANLKETPSRSRLPVGEGRRLSYSSPVRQAVRAAKSTSPTTATFTSRRGTGRVTGTLASEIPEYRSTKDVKTWTEMWRHKKLSEV